MQAQGFPKVLATSYKITWQHNPENNLNMLCSKFPTVTANFNLTAFLG
jgi:hypothetical protein